MLEVGRVIRPHGLRGQVVVEMTTNRPERTEPGAVLHVAGRPLTVTASSKLPEKNRWLIALAGVSDREAADALRGAPLAAEPIEVEGAYWVHELIGAALTDGTGALIGRVEAVEANPASDLLVVDTGALVPLTFVTRSDDGSYVVDAPPGLLDDQDLS